MGGARVHTDPGSDVDALPYGVVTVDRDGTVKSYKPFEDRVPSLAHERMLGHNFFSDVVTFAPIRRFHDRFWAFVTREQTAIEPFEFVAGDGGERRVTILFIRDEDIPDRISIVIMKNGRIG